MQDAIRQAYELITKSRNVVILLPEEPSTDAVASGLAMCLLLQKLEKHFRVVAHKFELPTTHHFLPKSKDIESELTQVRKFLIQVDVSKTPVEELSYDIIDNMLNIYLTPKSGYFETKDVTAVPGEYTYDLIIALDAPSLPSLGEIYKNNADFFYRTPIINIDHHAGNEQFGQVNIVDIVSTSVSEIVFELLKEFGHNLLDEHIATNLLTGIISKTKGFRALSATPRSLTIASHLISQGARREDIINNLYRTKSLSVIQLWGRALARLQATNNGLFVYSKLNRNDFERSQADDNDLPAILDEIMVNAQGAEIAAIVYERTDGRIGIIVASMKSHDSLAILSRLDPAGNANLARVVCDGQIADGEQLLRSFVDEYLASVTR